MAMRARILGSMVLPAALAALAVACGGSAPPPAPPPEPPPPPAPTKPRLSMSAELGEIDEVATKKTFERVRPSLMACYTTGLTRVEYLSGDIKFYMRVKPDGHVRWVFFEQST